MKRHSGLSDYVRQRTERASRRATRGALGLWAWSNDGDLRSRSRRGQETRAERRSSTRRSQRGRRGSTLLVVLGLLGMLSLLGLIYFSFANQEQQNATYFAEAAKGTYQEDDIEAIFSAAMKQIVIGAEPTQPNSVMWGRRHSMLYNLIGWDVQPHTGTGVHLILNGSGGLVVDQNFDGSDDGPPSNADLRNVNDSPAAHFQFQRNVLAMPAPDVDYTYPDINNMFLGYKGYTWDYRLNPPAQRLVIKPPFHRPELFRNGNGQPMADWAISQSTAGRSFRAHPFHQYVWRQDTSGAPQRRFIIDASSNPGGDPTLAGFAATDAALIGGSVTNQVSSAFPFLVNLNDPSTGSPDANLSEQGVFSADGNVNPIPGLGNVSGWDQYEYDVDNDGDLVRDGIWMDFDMPILVRPSDNRPYIPLISAAIYDLDSLLNANLVGNTFGDTRSNNTTNFGNGGPISVSAQGLSSPAEINPLYGLNTTYAEASAEAQTDMATYFGHVPAAQNVNWSEMANMEYWLSLKGHVRYSTPNQIYAGRFGEANRMWNVLQVGGAPISVQNSANSNLFPYPGIYDIDDNRDANEGHRTWLGGSSVGTIESFRHPLLLGGRGRYWTSGATGPKVPLLYSVAGNPLAFLQYQDVFNSFDALNSSTAFTGPPQWFGLNPFGAMGSNPLMTYTNTVAFPIYGANFGVPIGGAPFPKPASVNDYYLVDDSMEVTVDPKSLQRPYDETFEAIDTLYLQMANADRNSTGITSRLADTMPGNLVIPTGSASPNQVEVGQRFTSLSWDLKHFGLRRHSATGSFNRDWEFNVDFDNDGNLEFPPQFNPVLPGAGGGGTPYVPAIDPTGSPYLPENAYGSLDPFRPQLRRLLSLESGSSTDSTFPKRLSLNEFLDVERRPGTTPSSYTSPLQYRQLTPHSTDSAVQNLPTPTANTINQAFQEQYTLPAFPPAATGTFSAEEVKEFWARRDRQQLARDIYVLLYTFCGGNDSTSITTPGGSTATGNVMTRTGFDVHPGNVRRQMAQFAVNFVDALDTDNVITAFEFDHNLFNGWSLDDDPATVEGGLAVGEREVVYGIETPQLTFSEAAWYRQTQQGTDNPQTPYNDTTGEFNFVQLELRSIFPESVSLADPISTTAAKGIWRVLRDDNNNGSLDAGENAVIFLNPAGSISSGALYTIASSDSGSLGGGGFQSSLIYIDHTGALTDFEMVCPNVAAGAYNGASQPANGVVNLDLLHPNDTTKFALANGSAGDFLSRSNSPATNVNPVPSYFTDDTKQTVFALQRRLNPRLPQLSLTANPFISVDAFDRDGRTAAGKIGVNLMELDFNGTITNQAQAQTRLTDPSLRSTERGQPLKNIKDASATDDLALSGSVTPAMLPTTFTLNNSNSPAQFNQRYLFLPHFDRDYSSIVELFHIPLFGPGTLTRDAQAMWLPPELSPGAAGDDLGQLGVTIDSAAANKTYIGPLSFGAAVFLQSEDRDHNGSLAASEDTNGNGVLDTMPSSEDTNGNGWLDYGEDLNNSGTTPDSHPYHFQRFFAFAEVPTRTHRQLGDPLQQQRVPGRINLNGVRDPRVLAGLIDDLQVHGIPERDAGGPNPGYTEDKNLNGILDAGEDLNGNGTLDVVPPDAAEDINGNGQWNRGLSDVTGSDASRDWWGNFLLSRDGLDPTSQMMLPLSGTSHPFRDFGLTPNGTNTTSNVSLEDSVFRSLLSTQPKGRRLFELTNDDEFTFPDQTPVTTAVSPLMQHRLLSKMVGNTTTRSNCFVVFVTIGMFECVQFTPPGTTEAVTRIGGPLLNGTTQVTYRKAYIVDRSVALEANDQGTGSFDWKKLVMAQQRIK